MRTELGSEGGRRMPRGCVGKDRAREGAGRSGTRLLLLARQRRVRAGAAGHRPVPSPLPLVLLQAASDRAINQ